jgi:hypothetical protein
VTASTRFVIKPDGGGGPPRVERAAGWRLIGARESEPTAEEARDEFMLGLRDAGTGPEPIVSYSDEGGAGRTLHLDWPDLATHSLDPEYARLLALASIPLGREVPELDATPPPDPDLEGEMERLAHEDRRERALLVATVEGLVSALAPRLRALRRMRRARARPHDPTEQVPTSSTESATFEGALNADGWLWRRVGNRRLRLRARWR